MKVSRCVDDVHSTKQHQRIKLPALHFLLHLSDFATVPLRRQAIGKSSDGWHRGKNLQVACSAIGLKTRSKGDRRRSSCGAKKGASADRIHWQLHYLD